MPRSPLVACLAALALAGCANERNTDLPGFTQAARTPDETAILRTIATYRTTKDEARACTLVTARFIRSRFEGEADNCRQVQRVAPRYLPDSAEIKSVTGAQARVLVDEPTSTRSIYEMRREGEVWQIDDIVEAP